ncbi:MAG TPA: M56 family metallopeptidase [Bryobacteraceae bacterium]|nr:M56 family metallopeptidase [Bryobacteraceae bacterium]
MSALDFMNIGAAMALSSALNGLWVGLLLVVLASALLRILPRPNATTRYTVWFVTLILTVAAPLALLLPKPAQELAESATAPVAISAASAWPLYAAAAWLAITAILLGRIIWSLCHIANLKRRASLIGQRTGIRLLASPNVRVPIAVGFFRRAIIFPESVLAELSAAEFEQILCHEMAHLRRHDDWTQLIQALVHSVLFFNPAVYWIARRLKIEREIACDDWVVSATGQARPYAACLTHLHELTRRAAAPQLAPGATTRKRWQITARVEALLEPGRNATPRFSHSGWIAACALAAAALFVTAKVSPPVGVREMPVARMAVAQPAAPHAPAVSPPPRKVIAARPRTVLARAFKPMGPAAPPTAPEGQLLLVRASRPGARSPGYFVITVVFFEPPPPLVLHGI